MRERHELTPEPDPEREQGLGLARLIEQYLPDEDKDFILEMDFEDALGYVYGRLLENGEEPDDLLRVFGVTEE